jgi:hypothetical protein
MTCGNVLAGRKGYGLERTFPGLPFAKRAGEFYVMGRLTD